MANLPERARSLILEMITAEEADRRVPIPVSDAAVLREHGLIDYLGRVTELGREVAEDYEKEN